MIFQIHQEIRHSTAGPNSLSEFGYFIQAAGTSFHSLEAIRELARFHCKASGGSRSGSQQTPTLSIESHSDQRGPSPVGDVFFQINTIFKPYLSSSQPDEMNSRSLPYKENENPFAFDTELAQLEGRRPNRETPFSFFGDDRADDTTTVPDRAVTRDSNSSKLIRLQRCNIALRLATCVFCLTTILLIVLARQTKSGIELTNGKTGSGTATYKFSGTFKFLLLVYFLVLLYALLLSGLAIVMWKKGLGATTPRTLMWPAFLANMVTSSFLLLAFAAAVAVEVVARQGLKLGDILWQPICHWFAFFCFANELGLAAAAVAYVCLAASTSIDAYFLHIRKD